MYKGIDVMLIDAFCVMDRCIIGRSDLYNWIGLLLRYSTYNDKIMIKGGANYDKY